MSIFLSVLWPGWRAFLILAGFSVGLVICMVGPRPFRCLAWPVAALALAYALWPAIAVMLGGGI